MRCNLLSVAGDLVYRSDRAGGQMASTSGAIESRAWGRGHAACALRMQISAIFRSSTEQRHELTQRRAILRRASRPGLADRVR
jgi:hypothetical protein